MKNLVTILTLWFLFLIACASNNNQIPKSLSSSYDGIWDGYLQVPEGRQYVKMEIKNGIVSGFVEHTVNGNVSGFYEQPKINGYVNSDKNLIINPLYVYRGYYGNYKPSDRINFETNFMSPERIEGSYHKDQVAKVPKYDWYVVKPATGKSDSTMSNVEGNF